MGYDVETDWAYDTTISVEDNITNCEHRIQHLREWANKNWQSHQNAVSVAACAEVLEMRLESAGEDMEALQSLSEDEWDYVVEGMCEDNMEGIVEEIITYGDITEAYLNQGYQWMLWATRDRMDVWDTLWDYVSKYNHPDKDKMYDILVKDGWEQ